MMARFSVTANRAARINPRTSCPDQIWGSPGQRLRAVIQRRLGMLRLLPRGDPGGPSLIHAGDCKPRPRANQARPAPAAASAEQAVAEATGELADPRPV